MRRECVIPRRSGCVGGPDDRIRICGQPDCRRPGTLTGMRIRLRPLRDTDLDDHFRWESHPAATGMAAFTRQDPPTDRDAFDAHHQRVRADQANTLLAIEKDEQFVGTIGSFTVEDEREVTY